MPRWSGWLVAVGAPAHLLGFGIAQLVTTAAWPIAILAACISAPGSAGRAIGSGADTDRLDVVAKADNGSIDAVWGVPSRNHGTLRTTYG